MAFVAFGAVVCFAASIIMFFSQYHDDWRAKLHIVGIEAANRAAWIQADLNDSAQMLDEVQAHLEGLGGKIEPEDFTRFAAIEASSRLGVEAVYWAPRHPGSDGDRYPIAAAVPSRAPNLAGGDLAADAAHQAELTRARIAGGISPIDGTGLVAGSAAAVTRLFAIPIYRHPIPTGSAQDADVVGFVVARLRIDQLVERRLSLLNQPNGLDVYVFAGPIVASRNLIYIHGSERRSSGVPPADFGKAAGDPQWSQPIAMGHATFVATHVLSSDINAFSPEIGDLLLLAAGILGAALLAVQVTMSIRHMRGLEDRDRITHAVSRAVAVLQTASSVDAGITEALRLAGEAMEVDRVLVIEAGPDPSRGPVSLHSAWQAPDIEVKIEPGFFSTPAASSPAVLGWYAPLTQNREVTDSISTASSPVHEILEALHIKSVLLVPIHVDGTHWGNLGIDSCRREREWSVAEIDALRTLAEVVGATIARERRVLALANANKIVNNSATILFRVDGVPPFPLRFITGNTTWFDLDTKALLAEPMSYFSIIHPDDRPVVADSLQSLATRNSSAGRIEFRALRHGDYEWVESRFSPIRDAAGALIQVEGVISDISDRKQAEQQILAMARNDALTGLVNRRVFVEEVQLAMARTQRGSKRFAVQYLDLDHFKDINDTLGHPAGDALLKVTAERLSKGIREVDLVSRFGGDEFAVLQTDLSDPADAGTLATKLLALVSEPVTIDGNHIQIGTSIGIAVSEEAATDAESIMSHADVALYRAKAEGRGTYKFFTESMDVDVHKRVKLASDLREAFTSEQLFLVYQPQIDIASKRIIGVEALIRWRHPTEGLMPPPDFVAAAEKSGMAGALGNWVLRRACMQCRRWIDAGIAPPTIAVNFSPLQFKVPAELEKNITAVLDETGVPPHLVEIELTETALMETSREHNDLLQRLRGRGIKLAIDDFGTGYSSLSYLRRFPVDLIKLAQDFVKDVTRDPNDAAIVKAAIGLARELNLDVIAEGVETPEQVALLRSWGCDSAQGYYFAKPLSPEDVEPLLRRGMIAPATLAVG